MKIAVWHNLSSGGGKRTLYDHVRGLVERGHWVESWCPPVAAREYCPLTDWVKEHVVPIGISTDGEATSRWFRVRKGPRLARLRAIDRHCRQCAAEINRGNFDLLFANSCRFFNMTPIGRYVRIPRVIFLGEPHRPFYEASPSLPWPALERPSGWWRSKEYLKRRSLDFIRVHTRRIQAREELISARAFTSILVNSHYSRESVLRAYGLDSKVCYSGVDTALFADHKMPRKHMVVGLGAFGGHKNIHFVIQAISLINQPRPQLVWIGNDGDELYMSHLAGLAKSRNVDFQPRLKVSDAELVAILNSARVMAYAPRLEPFGLAPLEGNSCGLPVVAVAEGGVRESVIDGVNGVLVEHEPAAMASAIQQLLDNAGYACQLGENGRRLVAEKWTLQHSVDRLETRLTDVLKRGLGD